MELHDLLNRLQGVKGSGTKWTAHCPCTANHAHGDKNNSLSIALSGTRILLHCHTGCKPEDICSALGIEPKDLFTDAPQAAERTTEDKRRSFIEWYGKQKSLKPEKVYSYCYGNYSDGLMKIKYLDENGKKTFRWIHNDDAQTSGFKLSHEGCKHRLYVAGNLEAEEIFVVEGEKDADNLHSITGKTVVSAENGAQMEGDGSKWLQEYTDQLSGKTVVILFDNDRIGRDFAQIEADKIAQKAESVRVIDIANAWKECPEKGDVSDMIKALGKQETLSRLQGLINNAHEWKITLTIPEAAPPAEDPGSGNAEEELRKRTGAGMLDDFFVKISQAEEFKPIATGITDIDRALAGGFIRKTLVMLGAAPGMGKTALSQWIFENMAAAGNDILFFNLEMSREQLLARSISRYVWKYEKCDVSALDVLRAYSWTPETADKIVAGVVKYREDIAPHFIYNPDGVTNHINDILRTAEAETLRITEQGKPAPIICLDYLQLIDSGERDAIEGMKAVIFKLKDFAIKNNTIVFVIMANNRASNRAGTVEMESGRDSSAIEYSADILLGLSYTAIEDRRTVTYSFMGEIDETEEPVTETVTETCTLDSIRNMKKYAFEKGLPLPAVCNELSLKVLKNRFGETERRANLIFDGKHATFNQKVPASFNVPEVSNNDGWTPLTGKSPWDKK